MAGPTAEYVAASFAAWLCGGVAVPLCLSNPLPELRYTLEDAKVSTVLATSEYIDVLRLLCVDTATELVCIESVQAGCGKGHLTDVPEGLPTLSHEMAAIMVYTSGTTGRPKGALHTHGSLHAQCISLSQAWHWERSDVILHCLPLHHIHGIVNAWICCMHNGATVEFMPKFSPTALWARAQQEPPVSIFMGVPTMYSFLLGAYDKMDAQEQLAAVKGIQRLRLMVSGSAACPVPIMKRWEELTGMRLLERYGMTEIGMGLSNPYEPASERKPGFVGVPLPGQEFKVVPEEAEAPAAVFVDGPGEARLKGPLLFREYFGRPEATQAAFDEEGYFRTGDTVQRVDGAWKILGRSSVDIIKHGGYKLSALEIENHLLEHPDIAEVAVCGVADEAYGEHVGAVVVLAPGAPNLDVAALRSWAKEFIAEYKIPRLLKLVESIPRNTMGKVNKKELVLVFGLGSEK